MKKAFIFFSIFISILFLSCKKQNKQTNETETFILSVSKSNENNLITEPQKWHVTDKKICIIFGHDFNSPEITNELLALCEENFGLTENGGMIAPFVYPNDFKHGAKSYANDLASILQDNENDYCGVIILGAPERTHVALAKNQDKWNQNVPYPVVALFPQDDVLGLESTCDIVIDKKQEASITGEIEPEESENKTITEAPEVLISTINYIINLTSSLPKDSSIQKHVSQMLEDFTIHHYTDPETNLQSINHFVID